MNAYKMSKLNNRVEKSYNEIVFYESDMIKQMYNTANFTTTGKKTKAPDWAIRGHLAELHHQYSFKINSIAKLINQNRYGVATDKVGIGISRVTKNNPLVDIQVFDSKTKEYYNYQSKVCNTKEASIAAATAKKYLDNKVIPLVPDGHSNVYNKINVGSVSSDPITKEKLDVLTTRYKQGIVESHLSDKRPEIFINSLKHSSVVAVTSALQQQLINITLNEILNDSDENRKVLYFEEFALNSINNFIYSSVGTGLTLLTRNAIFTSIFLNTFRKTVINLLQYYDGKISFNDFVLNIGFDVVKTSMSVAASVIIQEGFNIGVIKKLTPVFKFAGIVLVVCVIVIFINEVGNKKIRVENQKRSMIYQYYEIRRNINLTFNQMEENLVDVMNNLIYNVIHYEEYFNKVNYNLLDIELSTEGLGYDEIVCIEQSSENLNVQFISIESIKNLL